MTLYRLRASLSLLGALFLTSQLTAFSQAAAAASAQPSTQTDKLEALLSASGTTKQIALFPEQTKAAFAHGVRDGGQIPEAVLQKMLDRADTHIKPDLIMREISASVGAVINNQSIAFLLEWYESDIGRRITEVEERASTASAYEQMVRQAPILLMNTQRVASAKRIDKLISATDMAMEMQEATGLSIYRAIMAALAPNKPLSLGAYKVAAKEMQPQVRENTHQFLIASMVYTYLTIDDESLRAYENFLGHPTTRRFNRAAFSGINRGTRAALDNWMADIARVFKEELEAQ